MTHEITLKKNEEDEFKGKKSIALKVNSVCDSSDDAGTEEDEVAMLTKRIRRIITKNKRDSRPRRFQKNPEK